MCIDSLLNGPKWQSKSANNGVLEKEVFQKLMLKKVTDKKCSKLILFNEKILRWFLH